MVYTLRFFSSSKCSLFHNSNVFGSCINHILYTGCAKIKKKIRHQKDNLSATQLVPSSVLPYSVPSMQAISHLRATRTTYLALDYFSSARSAVDLGFQYSLSPFSTVFDSCRAVFVPVIFTFSSTLSFHLLFGRAFFYLFHCGCCSLLWFCILSTWPYQLKSDGFYKFYIICLL